MQDTRYLDAWIRVPLCKEGDTLYHYTTAEGVRGIVENQEFVATKSDFLNDKLEFQYAMEVMERLTEKYIVNQALAERFYTILQEETERIGIITPVCTKTCQEEDGMSFYVVSFSKQQNSSLLWAEFTDFSGYCLEFDYISIVKSFQNRVFLHGTVLYDEEEQMQCLLDSLLYCIQDLSEEGMTDLGTFFEEEATISEKSLQKLAEMMAVVCSVYAMFFKKNFFAGEEEYRFVFSPRETGKPKFRLLHQMFLPYIMVEYERGGEPIPLKSVMVGAKNNSDIAVRGMRYFLKTQGLEIPVLLSDIPLRY